MVKVVEVIPQFDAWQYLGGNPFDDKKLPHNIKSILHFSETIWGGHLRADDKPVLKGHWVVYKTDSKKFGHAIEVYEDYRFAHFYQLVEDNNGNNN